MLSQKPKSGLDLDGDAQMLLSDHRKSLKRSFITLIAIIGILVLPLLLLLL